MTMTTDDSIVIIEHGYHVGFSEPVSTPKDHINHLYIESEPQSLGLMKTDRMKLGETKKSFRKGVSNSSHIKSKNAFPSSLFPL